MDASCYGKMRCSKIIRECLIQLGREKQALLITKQTSLTPPEGYFIERLVKKSHDEAAQLKTADLWMNLLCFETVSERNEV